MNGVNATISSAGRRPVARALFVCAAALLVSCSRSPPQQKADAPDPTVAAQSAPAVAQVTEPAPKREPEQSPEPKPPAAKQPASEANTPPEAESPGKPDDPDPGLDDWQATMLAETLAPSGGAAKPESKPPGWPRPLDFGELSRAVRPGRSPTYRPRTKPHARPRLVAYAFESAFDDGSLGRRVAEVVTGHAARTGQFETLPKITLEEMLGQHPFRASLDTRPAEMARHAREAFDADVVVWGRVTDGRAKPVISVKALDLRAKRPTLVLAETYRCANIHLIPMYADEIVASLLGRERFRRLRPRKVKALSKNLLANGTFNRGISGWTPNFPQFVSARGGRLVFDVDKSISGGHGLDALSDYVRVEPGAHYELSLRVRSHKPSVITWVKGYAEFPARNEGERVIDPRREVFRHQMRPASQEEPGPDGWIEVATHPFRPRHPKVKVTWMRVKLYGYHPPGKVEFDDVVLRRVAVEGESAESEDERTRRAWEGKDPGEALDKEREGPGK